VKEVLVNIPNFACGANTGSDKNYEIESNSILIPDYYVFFHGSWLGCQDDLMKTVENRDVDDWDSREEQAFFTGMPTSLHMELFEDLGLPSDNSYASAL
jgi:hypothetical protein